MSFSVHYSWYNGDWLYRGPGIGSCVVSMREMGKTKAILDVPQDLHFDVAILLWLLGTSVYTIGNFRHSVLSSACSCLSCRGDESRLQQFCYPFFVALHQQDRNIAHSFCRNGKLFCHAGSLPQFQNVVSI